jgi:hypothetical protein
VDTSCRRLIGDFEQVVFAENGELDQKTNKELTHISDACGYWIVRDFPIVSNQAVASIKADNSWQRSRW